MTSQKDFYKLRVSETTNQMVVTVSPAAGSVWLYVSSKPDVSIDTNDASTYEVRIKLMCTNVVFVTSPTFLPHTTSPPGFSML